MINQSPNQLIAKSPALQRARLAALPNLVKSNQPGHLEKYFQLLTDFEFVEAKNQHPNFGVDALITDCDLINYPDAKSSPDYNQEKVKSLKLIQGTLQLSAHIIRQDRTQLAGQLWGRLLPFQMPELQGMLAQIKNSKSPWLRLLAPSLIPPGGRLLRTLTGHSHWVEAVAVTADGKHAISGSFDNTLKVWNLETEKVITTFVGDYPLICCAVAPNGVTIVAGDISGHIHFLRMEGMGR